MIEVTGLCGSCNIYRTEGPNKTVFQFNESQINRERAAREKERGSSNGHRNPFLPRTSGNLRNNGKR